MFTTGLVLRELLQGFAGPKARTLLRDGLAALALLQPDREDHIDAAEGGNRRRRREVRFGTIDALPIQPCRRHELALLSTDKDFEAASKHIDFGLWCVR
jgi:predicted nucleic acid-binding protein